MPLAVSMELPPPTLTNASADASAARLAATAMESVGECGFTVSYTPTQKSPRADRTASSRYDLAMDGDVTTKTREAPSCRTSSANCFTTPRPKTIRSTRGLLYSNAETAIRRLLDDP